MSKILEKIRQFFRSIRDKPVDGQPVPIEPGEIANPSPESAVGAASLPAADADSVSTVSENRVLKTDAEYALETGLASVPEDVSPAPEEPPKLDPQVEKERNKQYKASLSSAAMWMDTRFEANMCPKEELVNFKILGKLGSGGYANVFKVKYRVQDKVFALKVQDKRTLAKKTYVAWAVREKKFIHAIQCEFVAKLYFAFKDARNLYMVMDYASRGDLSRLFGTRLPERALKLFIAQIVLGLEYLHACKIAHRDMKAKNVFICEDMYLKIGDFGLAKKVPVRTFTSVGTPHYMAPEMFKQRGYRVGVDWWAMAIILYRLVYNQHPYAEHYFDKHQVMDSLQNVVLSFPREVYPNSSVNKLLIGLLEKNVVRRLGMMKAGADDIKQHEWFSDVSFCNVLKKSERINVELESLQPEVLEVYDFIPAEGEEDFKPNFFEEF